MDKRTTERLSLFVVGLGLLLSAGAFILYGVEAGRSAAIGAALAVVNWYLLRWLVSRVMDDGGRGKVGVILLVFLKMGALMGLIALLLFLGLVTPIAFVVGLSSLVGGILFGSFLYIAGGTAGSER